MFFSRVYLLGFLAIITLAYGLVANAHGISGGDARFLNQNEGFQFLIYLYLGAKHMVTGYDHLMFLFGVIFYLTTLRSVALYVSLFAIGHSITLIFGVLTDIQVNVYIIDAIIGLSVVYKAFDNLGGFERFFGISANNRSAVFIFGLFHGFGLATKLQEMTLSEDGLLANLLSFNLGVELGQIIALIYLLLLLSISQRITNKPVFGISVNIILMAGGFSLTSYQLAHYFTI
jgi:HupE/UreJ protein